MKKTTLFITTTVLFFLSTIAMLVLFVLRNRDYNDAIQFWVTMVDAYWTAIDYQLCMIDYFLDNIRFESCERYLNDVVETTDILKDNFWLETTYNYIWD